MEKSIFLKNKAWQQNFLSKLWGFKTYITLESLEHGFDVIWNFLKYTFPFVWEMNFRRIVFQKLNFGPHTNISPVNPLIIKFENIIAILSP
jgi:hypothetical protein